MRVVTALLVAILIVLLVQTYFANQMLRYVKSTGSNVYDIKDDFSELIKSVSNLNDKVEEIRMELPPDYTEDLKEIRENQGEFVL